MIPDNENSIPEFNDEDRQPQSEEDTFDMGDLWDDEDEELEDEINYEGFDESVPTVRVISAGRAPITVPLPQATEGEVASDTVSNILDRAGIAIRAGQTDVYVDGAPAALDTKVFANSTVAPVGAVKGG